MSHPDFAVLTVSWELALRADGFAANTVKAYQNAVRSLADWLADRDEPGTYEGRYRPVLVAGDQAVARGYSRYFDTNGAVRDEYDNLFLLRFDADGRCAEFREWYMPKPKPEDG